MTGKTLDIEQILVPDQLGTAIADKYCLWETLRQVKVDEWKEIQQYVFATDTTKTSNAKLPWSNKTTIPKLAQIRDNLFSNYMASMFPKQKWMIWEGSTEEDEDQMKKETIENYMLWVVDRPDFKKEVQKLVLDYIDYGNCFAMPAWVDERSSVDEELRVRSGYVGPAVQRISPTDIVFDPTAPTFGASPKIIRSIVSIGEVKEILERESNTDEQKEEAEALFKYLNEMRAAIHTHNGSFEVKEEIYNVSGFGHFSDYLQSNYAEVLTFYGDIFDENTGKFLRNRVIQIVDRHKILVNKPNPSIFGRPPIFHASWRNRPDNLWGMGPLDNLVGMQYRIDHLENIKSDVFDLIAYPPLVIKGQVQDFEWQPMERIYLDSDGDIELLSPDVQALQANTEIAILEAKMEEMSGSPREAMGFRSPGEKTKFEVQQLQNAASRIFENKIAQFESEITERALSAMLELARRNMTTETIRIFDDELKIATFQDLSANDLIGNGRLRPVAARHFAEQAQQMQNLSSFWNSAVGQDPEIRQHFSSIEAAKLIEKLLELEDFNIVQPYIRLSEQADAQRQANIHEEEVTMEASTPIGIAPDDFDPELV